MILALIPLWLYLAGMIIVWAYGAHRFPMWYRNKELEKYSTDYRGNAIPRRPDFEDIFEGMACVFGLGLIWPIAIVFAYGLRRGQRQVAEVERVVLLEQKQDELARTVGLTQPRKAVQLPVDPYDR